jgi:capsular exopolysaccharide synthesis family protein
MDNLEKYLGQVMEQKPVVYETSAELPPEEEEAEARPDLFKSVARRWYIVLATTVVLCAIGIPAIWLLVEPRYEVSGAVEVRPAESILTGAAASDSRDRTFINTEAHKLRTDPALLQRVASSLVDRKLAFFSGQPQTLWEKLKAKVTPARRGVDTAEILREALSDGTIVVSPLPNAQLLAVTMKSTDADEAKVIVNSFLDSYSSRYATRSVELDERDRKQLEDKQKKLLSDMEVQRGKIRAEAEKYGSTSLDTRYEMELSRQASLLNDLTRLQSQESTLRARLGRLDPNDMAVISPEQILAARTEYVNSDPTMAAISRQIADLRRELIALRQARKPGNALLTQQEGILAALEEALEEERTELEKKFDAGLEERLKTVAQQRRAAVFAELEEVVSTIKAREELLAEQEKITRAIGSTNLEIQKLQDDLDVMKTTYDQVALRLSRIDVEGQGRPRVGSAYDPAILNIDDKRPKFSAGVFFLALGCGFGLAFLKDKTDKTLQTADDVARHLDLPVLGTTSSSHTVKPSLFAEQITADYQAIRTNLGLLTNGGIPRKLAVSSPGMREGKTTFAVNLATSLAKAGKKVLLIDGDLRKPDVRYMLNVTNGAGGIQDVLMGASVEKAIGSVPASGLHVLAASSRNVADVYELLVSSHAAEQIERLGREYDHLIIDTPPVLGFPDALIWARLAGAVVLVGFAGQTTAPELKEAKEKFARVRVQVLGAILSNVRTEQNVYRYGYNYRAAGVEAVRKARQQRKLLLTPQGATETDKTRST